MTFKFCVLAGLVMAAPASAQSDSVSKTLFTRKDAGVAAAALVATAAISQFDTRIAAFFDDTSLSHVRTGQRFDHIFTHVNETTLTAAGILAYGVGRLTKSPAVTDIAFHTTEAVVTASLASQVIRGPLGRSVPAGRRGHEHLHVRAAELDLRHRRLRGRVALPAAERRGPRPPA